MESITVIPFLVDGYGVPDLSPVIDALHMGTTLERGRYFAAVFRIPEKHVVVPDLTIQIDDAVTEPEPPPPPPPPKTITIGDGVFTVTQREWDAILKILDI